MLSKKSLAHAVALTAALGLAACGQAAQSQAAQSAPGASQSVTVKVPDGMNAAPFDQARKLTVPSGFAISVFARVDGARFMAVAPNGDVLVSQPGDGKVTLLRPREGQAPQSFTFASGLNRPHDLVFHEVSGKTYLYVSEQDKVGRYLYTKGDTGGQGREVVVTGLPGGGNHPLKNIALNGDQLYVSIGSSSNADPKDLQMNPKRAAIYVYSANKTNQPATSGTLFAQGIRNAEGLTFAPGSDKLWVVVNNRDNIAYPFHKDLTDDGKDDYGQVIQAYVNDHPPEEVIQVKQGANYGWPYCNPDPDSATGLSDMPFNHDAQNNPDGQTFDCTAKATRVDKGIHAHSAPLGVAFWTGGPGAYKNVMTTGLHGCWNCSKAFGYKVVFFPLLANGTLGDEADLVSGWVTDPATKQQWGRPVDTLPMSDGSLLISDDGSGTVYRLYQK